MAQGKNVPPRQITKSCWAQQPGGQYHCTLLAGHSGDHKHAYSGPKPNGYRTGTTWRR